MVRMSDLRTTVKMPQTVADALKTLAKRNERSLAGEIRAAIVSHLAAASEGEGKR